MERQGFLPWLRTRLFGQRTAKLSEELRSTHWLSYLLVLTQSAAAVLVLGHSELPLLFGGEWIIRSIVALAVFVLMATVYAADMCLLQTLKRVPILARNRSTFALWEHMLFVVFVLLVEGSTYAIVMATLDTNPQALLGTAPLIPPTGPLFIAQVGLRAVLVCWTTLQLYLVRGKLPPQLITLLGKGKEIVGGQVEHQLARLDLSGASLAAAFHLYAAMSRAPRRAERWFNRWLVRLEVHQEHEEERQTQLVVEALQAFERSAIPALPALDARHAEARRQEHEHISTGGNGTAETNPEPRRRREQSAAIRLVAPTKTFEEKARRVLAKTPNIGKRQLAKVIGCSESHAGRLLRTIREAQDNIAAS